MERTIKVFVYGTLRKGERNHHYLKKAELLEESCWTYGTMIDTGHGYPALLPSESNKVIGELYLIHPQELKRLDKLEGYEEGQRNNLYERVVQPIYTSSEQIDAFVYIMNDDCKNNRIIPSGNWKNRTSRPS